MSQQHLTPRELIGRTGIHHGKHFDVPVKIVDVRWNYGRTDVLIVPIDGEGETYVKLSSIELDEKPCSEPPPSVENKPL